MEELKQLESISQANALVGKTTLHPLVTVIDFSKHGEMEYTRMNLGFYGVFQECIQGKLIEVAKERMWDTSKSVTKIAYEPGFKYPQHFTRLFKQKVGQTPNENRSLN